MRVHLTLASRNKKTGPIPVSTTSSDSCPDSCPFKNNGCYAQLGPLAIHWKAVDKGRGDAWHDFLGKIRRLPKFQLWRHNQAGDLPGAGDEIDAKMLDELVRANRGRNGFTYTHKPMTTWNEAAVIDANINGFTINASANSLDHADELIEQLGGLVPVVAVVPRGTAAKGETRSFNKYVVCPAQLTDDIDCSRCGLCQQRGGDRPIVAFYAHGSGAKKIEATLMEN